jgi:hypothetical protein
MAHITLVFENNAYLATPMATLWLVKGVYDSNDDKTPYPPNEDPRARKILGPIDFHLCGELDDNLWEALRELGHEVTRHAISDD